MHVFSTISFLLCVWLFTGPMSHTQTDFQASAAADFYLHPSLSNMLSKATGAVVSIIGVNHKLYSNVCFLFIPYQQNIYPFLSKFSFVCPNAFNNYQKSSVGREKRLTQTVFFFFLGCGSCLRTCRRCLLSVVDFLIQILNLELEWKCLSCITSLKLACSCCSFTLPCYRCVKRKWKRWRAGDQYFIQGRIHDS